ncbi:hypothetical protein RF11_14033 [Thelohanellus kitauei]|uniref:Uncharacterized protein n=1 Tax=Thelohanellus kitauei TaxID=669202 RepID=A0A0C2IEX5_THEKT|nr:hypothetical protein RF11_14033 [Thelohanellus kitauei]
MWDVFKTSSVPFNESDLYASAVTQWNSLSSEQKEVYLSPNRISLSSNRTNNGQNAWQYSKEPTAPAQTTVKNMTCPPSLQPLTPNMASSNYQQSLPSKPNVVKKVCSLFNRKLGNV